MSQYYACKAGQNWKFVSADSLDFAFRKAFGYGYSPYNRLDKKNLDEIGVLIGTRKPDALTRFASLEAGEVSVAHCDNCGTAYLTDTKGPVLRLCPGDCGRTVRSDGKPLYEI